MTSTPRLHQPTPPLGTWQPLHLLACAEGWAMVRYVGCTPFVITRAEWLGLVEVERENIDG